MTRDQVRLVRESWQMLVPIWEQMGEEFYNCLIELDPSVRPLFRTDLRAQGHKLTTMINTVVVGLDRIEHLLPVIRDLGRRHVDYGVTDGHYESVCTALLSTLAAGLGDAFTSDTEAAWTEAYSVLASEMKCAAAPEIA